VTSSHAATLCYGRVVTIYCPLHWEGATVPVGSAAAASPASTNGQSHQEGDLRFTIAAQPLGAGISQITSLGSFMRATFTISFTALVTCIIAILALSALQPASNRRSPDPSVVRQSMLFLIFTMIGYVSAGTSSEATYTLDGDHWAMLDTLLGILLNGHGIYRARRSALLLRRHSRRARARCRTAAREPTTLEPPPLSVQEGAPGTDAPATRSRGILPSPVRQLVFDSPDTYAPAVKPPLAPPPAPLTSGLINESDGASTDSDARRYALLRYAATRLCFLWHWRIVRLDAVQVEVAASAGPISAAESCYPGSHRALQLRYGAQLVCHDDLDTASDLMHSEDDCLHASFPSWLRVTAAAALDLDPTSEPDALPTLSAAVRACDCQIVNVCNSDAARCLSVSLLDGLVTSPHYHDT